MKTQKIIKELLDENLIGAKQEIMDLLYEKMSERLSEAYVDIAPTLVSEGKKKHDKDGDGDEDSDDWKMARDEAIKGKKLKKEDEEDEEDDDDEEDDK